MEREKRRGRRIREIDDVIRNTNRPNVERETPVASGSKPRSSRKRGKTRNIGLDREVEAHGRLKIVIDEAVGKPICRLAPKFSNAIGSITREGIPLHCRTWDDVPEQVIQELKDRISTHWDMDLSKDHVHRYLESTISKRFKEYRAELYQDYLSFEDPVVARANPPEDLTNPEDWQILCDRWEDVNWKKNSKKAKESRAELPFNHRTGKKSFVQVQQELKDEYGRDVDQVELFYKTHFNIDKEWTTLKDKAAYCEMQKLLEESLQEDVEEPMTTNQIVQCVLGQRSGHIKGLGWDPKSASSKMVKSNTPYEKHLEKTVADLRSKVEDVTKMNETVLSQMAMWEGRWAEMQNLCTQRRNGDEPSNT